MNKQIEALILSFMRGQISKEVFLNEYFDGSPRNAEYLKSLIDKAIQDKDSDSVEEAMILIYTREFELRELVTRLCELITSPWHVSQEGIAVLLQEIADPKTVSCLTEAAELEFDHMVDETNQFARKCIKALARIGTEEAIEGLRSLSDSVNPQISMYANKELQR